MSALPRQATPAPPATKRAKTKDVKMPTPRGIGLVIRSEDVLAMSPGETPAPSASVWVMDGDRTRKVPELWNPWSAAFHGQEPHNIYMVDVDENGEYLPLFVPGNAHKTGENRLYTPQECGRAMLKHALSKGWLPKCVISEEEAMSVLEQINTKKSDKKGLKKYLKAFAVSKVDGNGQQNGLTDETVQKFIDVCVEFTKKVMAGDSEGRPYLLTEVVCGKIESDSTADQTVLKEGHEESGAPLEDLRTKVRSTGLVEYVTKYGSSWSATYECRFPKLSMESWWRVEHQRRSTLTNWFCAHGWFSNLPGIDEEAMDILKGNCETCHGRWVSVEEARAIVDEKSRNILEHVLDHC